MRHLWPIALPIKEDELLSSWIIRNSLANGSDPMTWTWAIWGKWRPWAIDLDRYCPNEKLLKLCNQMLSAEQLKKATLLPTVVKILGGRPPLKQSWPWITPLGSRNRERTGGLRFCPECLKEEPVYFRKKWRLSWNHTCTVHNVLLQEYCPECSSPLMPHKADFDHPELHLCKRCGYDLSSMKFEQKVKTTFLVQHLLNSAITSKDYKSPWGIVITPELFATVRYLYCFLNLASKQATTADKTICKTVCINTSLRPTNFHLDSIDKAPPIWIHELDCSVSKLLNRRVDEISELFCKCGITQESLHKTKVPISQTIQNILSSLPSNSRTKSTKSKPIKEIKPKSKEEVKKMWLELQKYLK